ncbi:MAG: hypothetical protein VW879_12830 [Opitutae bacterium]
MAKTFIFLPIITLCLLFTGCGAGSIYGPGYYSETKVSNDVRRVTFKGGDHPITGDLCLLRCAEVTLKSGNSYFQVVDSESGSSINQMPSAYPFHRHYHMDDPFLNDIAFVTKTIRLLNTEPESGFFYNAQELRNSMRQKYEIE